MYYVRQLTVKIHSLSTGQKALISNIVGAIVLIVVMQSLLLPNNFYFNRFYLSHDTATYTNVGGISHGMSLENFSSNLRLPGYPLFFFLVTFGEIPHEDTIVYALCGNSVWKANTNCDTAQSELKADITVRADPVIYGYSKATSRLLQRTIEASRFFLVASLIALFVALLKRLGMLPSLLTIMIIVWALFLDQQHTQDVLQTESLFPAIVFLYVAFMLKYIGSKRSFWPLIATLSVLYAFLVRPAYVYMPILHLVIMAFLAVQDKRWLPLIVNGGLTTALFVWFLTCSPVEFFAFADRDSALLRTAVLGDQQTVDCVTDPAQKALLRAYLNSTQDSIERGVTELNAVKYMQRYYAIAFENLYRITLRSHPIYRQPGIDGILTADGSIPDDLIAGMLASAHHCQIWRNVVFTSLNMAIMLGLTPAFHYSPHYFFQSPYIFWVSAFCILVVMLWSVAKRDWWWLFLSAIPSALYFGTIVIIAVKQGAESRYSFAVEPLFVVSASATSFYFLGELASAVRQHWPHRFTAVSGRSDFFGKGDRAAGEA